MKHSVTTGNPQEFLTLTAETLKEAAELLETSKGVYFTRRENTGFI